MRERRGTNAVSVTVLALLFLMVGVVIAVCTVLAGWEAPAVKTALLLYAFIVGPLFLAGAVSSSRKSLRHRSFRGTPPAHLEGRRIKPRLRLMSCGAGVVGLLAAFAAFVGIIALTGADYLPDGLATILFCFMPFVAYCLTILVSKWALVRLGWMTREEASGILSGSRRLPESWLEPVDEGKPAKPDLRSISRRTYLTALVAMLVAAGSIVALSRSGSVPGGLVVEWLLVYGIAAATYFVVVSALKRRYVRLGIISWDEVEFFPSWSRRWPEAWLEPIDKGVAVGHAEQTSETMPESETGIVEDRK